MMKGMVPPVKMTRHVVVPMLNKHELVIRRAPNHNVHVMTHHGKVVIGRKGRTM